MSNTKICTQCQQQIPARCFKVHVAGLFNLPLPRAASHSRTRTQRRHSCQSTELSQLPNLHLRVCVAGATVSLNCGAMQKITVGLACESKSSPTPGPRV
eukprot:scaffold123896_cov20-Tisochrysis_lutea.AAC.3